MIENVIEPKKIKTGQLQIDFKIKIVITGSSGVGKTSILHQYVKNEFEQNLLPTIGVSFYKKIRRFQEYNVEIQFWDTAGQERLRSQSQTYYKGSDGIILTYDITSQQSFDQLEYWVKEIERCVPQNSIIILIGNKSDLNDKRRVTEEQALEFASLYNVYFIEVSAKNNFQINKAMDHLVQEIFNSLSQQMIEERMNDQFFKLSHKEKARLSLEDNKEKQQQQSIFSNFSRGNNCCSYINQIKIRILTLLIIQYISLIKLQMLSDLFGNEEQIDTQPRILQNSCADDIDMPFIQRKQFVGLKNQGATCYLNSFFQLIYLLPEVKNIFLKIDIEEQKKKEGSSWTILEGIQKLILNMKFLNNQNQTIDVINEAFGWINSEHMQQHDIQEAMRIVFEEVEKELLFTDYKDHFQKLLKGNIENYIECQVCLHKKTRIEEFYDIFVNVQNHQQTKFKTLQEALQFNIEPEFLIDDNKYFCENCNQKQDAKKGMIYKELPLYSFVYVNRFSFDYNTFQRIKLKNEFQYPEEIDFSPYQKDQEQNLYELNSILVHRGNPYGGHYFLVSKDLQQNDSNENNFYEFNDTLIKNVGNDYYKKFFNSGESAYILVYRKKNVDIEKDFQISEKNLYFQDILIENKKIQEHNQKYEKLKNTIKIGLQNLRKLIDLEKIIKDDIQLTNNLQKDDFKEIFIEKNKIQEFTQNLQIDQDKNYFYLVKLLNDPIKKIFYQQKIDLKNLFENEKFILNHNDLIVYIDKEDPICQDSFFFNFIENNSPVNIKFLFNKEMKNVLLNKKNSLKEIKQKIEKILEQEIQEKDLFITSVYNELFNLEQYQKIKPIQEILIENLQIKVLQEIKENMYYVIVKHGYIYNSFMIDKNKTLKQLFKKIRIIFTMESDLINLIDDEGNIIEESDEVLNFENQFLNFGIIEKDRNTETKNIKIYFLNQISQQKNEDWCEEIIDSKLPQKNDILNLIEKKTESNQKEFIFYKSNPFIEPMKRINFEMSSINQFELEKNQFILFVKIDGGFLEMESIQIIIYKPILYPNQLEKVHSLSCYMNWSLKEALQNIILSLIEQNIYQDGQVEQYIFQLFSKCSLFQLPGQYLDNCSKKQIKKIFSNQNKILVRKNEDRQHVEIDKVNIFLRQWNYEQEIYENYKEIYLNPKFKKINKKNYKIFKEEIKTQLNIEGEILLLIMNYKKQMWEKINDGQFFINNGQEIGYVQNYDKDLPYQYQDKILKQFQEKILSKEEEFYNSIQNKKDVKEIGFKINKKENEQLIKNINQI